MNSLTTKWEETIDVRRKQSDRQHGNDSYIVFCQFATPRGYFLSHLDLPIGGTPLPPTGILECVSMGSDPLRTYVEAGHKRCSPKGLTPFETRSKSISSSADRKAMLRRVFWTIPGVSLRY